MNISITMETELSSTLALNELWSQENIQTEKVKLQRLSEEETELAEQNGYMW